MNGIVVRKPAAAQFPRRELAVVRRASIVSRMSMAHGQARSGATAGGRALGRLLKEWRGRRGFSQLDLAIAARTTQRHLSFIESGRATPSREMVFRLAATLSLPLRQQNTLLLAAGYAPAWRERELSAPGMEVVDRALDFMLAQHEPSGWASGDQRRRIGAHPQCAVLPAGPRSIAELSPRLGSCQAPVIITAIGIVRVELMLRRHKVRAEMKS